MKQRMESSQLRTYNLTASDLVKDHLRYLVIIIIILFVFTTFLVVMYALTLLILYLSLSDGRQIDC